MKIWEEYDPDILTSHTEMEKETLTFLEIPGYATTELTPKDLQILKYVYIQLEYKIAFAVSAVIQ